MSPRSWSTVMNTTSLGGETGVVVNGAPSAFAVALMQLSEPMKPPARTATIQRLRGAMGVGDGMQELSARIMSGGADSRHSRTWRYVGTYNIVAPVQSGVLGVAKPQSAFALIQNNVILRTAVYYVLLFGIAAWLWTLPVAKPVV